MMYCEITTWLSLIKDYYGPDQSPRTLMQRIVLVLKNSSEYYVVSVNINLFL